MNNPLPETWSIHNARGTCASVVEIINAAPNIPEIWKEALKGSFPKDAQGVILHAFCHKHGDKLILQVDVTKLF